MLRLSVPFADSFSRSEIISDNFRNYGDISLQKAVAGPNLSKSEAIVKC
jgi:hypothetical protein